HGALPVCSISGRSCSVIKKFVPSPAQNSGPSLDMLNRHLWTSACAYATGRSATNNSTRTNVGSTSLCRRCSRRRSSVRLRKGITRPCLTPLGIRIALRAARCWTRSLFLLQPYIADLFAHGLSLLEADVPPRKKRDLLRSQRHLNVPSAVRHVAVLE